MELLQDGNVRAKGDGPIISIISFHPEDWRLTSTELEDVVCRAVRAAGLEEHQYIAVRHSEQEHEHLHVAVNKIHPETLKIDHPYKAIPAYQALASVVEEELGLRRVDRTPGPSLSHKARDFEASVVGRKFLSLGSAKHGRRRDARSYRIVGSTP